MVNGMKSPLRSKRVSGVGKIRPSARSAAAAALLAAFGCGPAPPAEPAGRTGQAEPGGERRMWRPANGQAEALGAVAVGREGGVVTFAFAEGVTVRATAIDKDAAVAELGTEVAALQEILGAPPDVRPWLYRVTRETVALSAGDGGLCGGLRTTHLIAAQFVDADNQWTLRIASLHRAPARAGAATHCFSFDFAS